MAAPSACSDLPILSPKGLASDDILQSKFIPYVVIGLGTVNGIEWREWRL
jgi:hypothetical protein